MLVLSPFGGRSLTPPEWGTHLAIQVDGLRAGGSRVETISPDAEAEYLFGVNAMDLSLRPAAGRAGHRQGLAQPSGSSSSGADRTGSGQHRLRARRGDAR